MPLGSPQTPLQMWGGMEPTLNRIRNRTLDQLRYAGHFERIDEDMALFASLGLRTLRISLHWERFAEAEKKSRNPWRLFDHTLQALQRNGIAPILGFVHHGSGPRDTSLIDPEFPEKLAAYARRVAERYPWVTAYTPVNEPNTTARFSTLYSFWYPHHRDHRSFARALFGQVRAIALAMQAIREVQPAAQLVTTEDGGRIASTPELAPQRAFREARRWLGTDLLCGWGTPEHALHGWLVDRGVGADELAALAEAPCPPDVLGMNYYLTSDRFLDHRLHVYPKRYAGGDVGDEPLVDVEALRVCPAGLAGARGILLDAWNRYKLPVAITECHLGSDPVEQMRWLRWIWQGALNARAEGADVRAVTVWALLGSFNWHCLCTRNTRVYEPGVFALGPDKERIATPLAGLVQQLATEGLPENAAPEEPLWWLDPGRLTFPSP